MTWVTLACVGVGSQASPGDVVRAWRCMGLRVSFRGSGFGFRVSGLGFRV